LVARFSLGIVLIGLVSAASEVQAADGLATLKPAHPRLLFSSEDFARTKTWTISDSLTRKAYVSLKAKAEQILSKPVLTYTTDGTPENRLLAVSREALDRISLLAAMYRMDGDVRYRDGAVLAMKSVAAFPDWHPPHFLDVAEMTFAVALGYDWLYDDLTPGARDTIRTAIATMGLVPGREAYKGNANGWWVKTTNNWNQVCNGGLVAGALAIAEDSSTLARGILDSALKSIPVSMNSSYAPDGGFPEGVGYWEYGTSYNVYLLASLQSALGQTFGLLQAPGFALTADYRLQMVGPTNLRYAYADQSTTNNFVSCMFWFAKTFNRPFYMKTERTNSGTPNIFALLWYDPVLAGTADTYALPLNVRYQKLDVAVFRSSWSDTNAWYVGFKGGDNKASHAHLDQGSFVFDQARVRWAADLGSDNYGVPNYFVDRNLQDGAHWKMYRTRTEGHNTLTISATRQSPLAFSSQSIVAKAPLLDFRSDSTNPYAIADLTASYAAIGTDARTVTKVHRGIRMWPNSQMLVQDEVVSKEPVEIVWNFLTEAVVGLNGKDMTLTRRGTQMHAQILSPIDARFDTVTCSPLDARTQSQKDAGALAENTNKGFTKVIIRLPLEVANTTIVVRFYPEGTSSAPPSVVPLAQWKDASPVMGPSGWTESGQRGRRVVELATGRRVSLETEMPVGAYVMPIEGRLRMVLVLP
jgi:hypothetical protein